MRMSKEIMIVAGEASGDLHGAHLVKAMRSEDPDLSFFGMGGVELSSVGVELLFDAQKVAVVGIVEVLAHLSDIIKAQKILKNALEERKPLLLIVIDFPDFNLMLAKKAKGLGVPVLYYISPQVWAWRSRRVRTIAERSNNIGVILPFEEKFYKDRGVEARYVGHPLLDSVKVKLTPEEFFKKHSLPEKRKVVGLLPGSRKREIATLLPIFLEAAAQLQDKSQEKLLFLIPLATTLTRVDFELSGFGDVDDSLDVRIIEGDRYELMSACDAVVAASGTVTLELALLDTPMVVGYKVSPHTYLLGRLLVKITYFSLVNLIAEEELVTELLQDEVNSENIVAELYPLLYDDLQLKSMKGGLEKVRNKLGSAGASRQAAKLALTTMKQSKSD